MVSRWCDVIRVEGMMSVGLRVSESLLGISMTPPLVFAFPSSPLTRELIQDLHPPPSPLSIIPINSMSSPVNAFSFEVSIPFLVVFEMTNVGDAF